MNFVRASINYEVMVGENKYQFIIPAGAPAGEAYDVAFQFLNLIATDAKAKAEQLKPEVKEEKNEK